MQPSELFKHNGVKLEVTAGATIIRGNTCSEQADLSRTTPDIGSA